MGASLVTWPTVEPITLAEAKAHSRIDGPDDDAIVASLLLAAREWVEGQTRRALLTQTWDFTYDFGWPYQDGRECLRLPLAPVQSITSVSYVDGSGATQVLSGSPAVYQAVLDTDNPRIVPTYDTSWPTPRNQAATITVRAVCGYGDGQGDVPQPLRLAVKLLAGHWFEHREAAAVGTVVELPLAVEALISPYRRP